LGLERQSGVVTTRDEIAGHGEGWVVRASTAITRWSRRRTVRANISEIYLDDPERRATLEEQLLRDRERRAARQELDRIRAEETRLRMPGRYT
jgi:hypothetical protein